MKHTSASGTATAEVAKFACLCRKIRDLAGTKSYKPPRPKCSMKCELLSESQFV